MNTGPAWQTRPATVAVAFMVVMGSALMLEGFFDRADHKRAETLVRSSYTIEGWSIGQYLEMKHQGVPNAKWSSSTKSSCAAIVQVRFKLEPPGAPPLDYRFVVETKSRAIHPGNDLGKALMLEWESYAKAHPKNKVVAPSKATETSAMPDAR